MKLEIWRDQKDVQGLLGGHKGVSFTLAARVQVSSEEKDLIDKYKVAEEVLAKYRLSGAVDPNHEFRITVGGLLAGHTVAMRDVASMIQLEEEIKSACANLKEWLAVMKTFGGYEAIEI